MTSKKVYEIDGAEFSTLAGFFGEISRKVIPDVPWGVNLDAFNDILGGGFGTPEEGFVLRWKNSELSRKRLGSPLFDELVGIIREHGQGGRRPDHGVELELQ